MNSRNAEHAADLGGAITSLVASGLPIEQGLRAAARELPPGRTAKALTALANKLERGETLETALAADDPTLPGHLRALVVAGLRSASLGRVLEEFVAAERHAADIYRKIMLAVSYPALLLVLISGVFALFAFGVLPGMMDVFEGFDLDLPPQTAALGQLSHAGYWIVVGNVFVLLGAWVCLWLAMRVAELRTMLVAVPLLGPIICWAALARFSRLLALLIDMEVPLPVALELTGRGCQDAGLDHASRLAAADMRAGAALSDALVARRQFPLSLGPMVRWGEQAAGRNAPSIPLGDALRTAADMFEGRMDAQLSLLRAVVEPLTFLFVCWGAAFIVNATILPLLNTIDKLT